MFSKMILVSILATYQPCTAEATEPARHHIAEPLEILEILEVLEILEILEIPEVLTLGYHGGPGGPGDPGGRRGPGNRQVLEILEGRVLGCVGGISGGVQRRKGMTTGARNRGWAIRRAFLYLFNEVL